MDFVKIFIPDRLFRTSAECQLFGEVRCNDATSTSVYIVTDTTPPPTTGTHTLIGCISSCSANIPNEPAQAKHLTNFLSFHFASPGSAGNIHLSSVKLGGPPVSSSTRYQIITYDRSHLLTITSFEVSAERRSFDEDFAELLNVLQRTTGARTSVCRRRPSPEVLNESNNEALPRKYSLRSPFTVIQHTSVFQHLLGRQMMLQRLDRKIACTIAMDMFLGISIMMGLLYVGQPYGQLTNYTEAVVIRVRSLLNALKGFPIGLKLNIELNNFFLNIFTYHINLWVTFLVLISPLINCLFVPFVMLGMLGLSFHLAILADLLVFISLHAHCFYIYVAVLYHIELVSIRSLWRVLLGKRMNPLKDRVESHEYSNSQLYLATMFFASLLFLMPTLLMYYVVFAFLRFCVYCITYVLIWIQREVMLFPVYSLVCRMRRLCINSSNVELCLLDVDRTPNPHSPFVVSHIGLRCHASSAEDERIAAFTRELPEMLSVFQFFMSLVKGNTMAFILPLGTHETK